MALNLKNKSEPNLEWMIDRPITHRGLHDASKGIYENTLSAARAAIDGGYNIEIDIQPSSEMVPMVFHDFTLDRLTSETGDTRARSSEDLKNISILNTDDKIPTLEEFLNVVDGEAGLVLELKGKRGHDEGFVAAVANLLESYKGNACLMSFRHHILHDARKLAPHLPLGLTAQGDDSVYEVHKKVAEKLDIDFISYDMEKLETKFVQEFKMTGRKIICWTVKSAKDKHHSDKFADQITFEGFKP